MKETVTLLTLVFNFIDGLEEGDINALLSKKARLAILYTQKEKTDSETALSLEQINEIAHNIESYSARNDAIEYLKDLNLKKDELIKIAKQFEISIKKKDSNANLVNLIIEGVVGSRLRYDALLHKNI